MDLVISRTGYSGELGYELYLNNASRDGLKLWDTVLEAGERHGLSPIGPCHIRRIEGGILAHGCDMTIHGEPLRGRLRLQVDGRGFDQDQDFIGREALREISHQGVRRRLVGVEIGGDRLGAYNDGSMPDFFPVLQDNGERIGQVTSACSRPGWTRTSATPSFPSSTASSEPSWLSSVPMRLLAAVVADRVFIKPEKAEQHLPAPGSSEGG